MATASQDFSKEMDRLNNIEDLVAHNNLKGNIFRRKALDPSRLKGLGYFGAAGLMYAYMPHIALIVGQSSTLFGLTSLSILGMWSMSEKNVINSIQHIKEGENKGKLKFNVSISPFTSKDLIVD